MSSARNFAAAALVGGIFVFAVVSLAVAQPAPGNQQAQQPQPDAAAEANRRVLDEYAEAAKLPGAAGKAECVWLGRRIVSLLWRDDVDTARRQIEVFDRFSCPSDHLRQTFRCVVRQGNIDPKAPEHLHNRVHGCWLNPDAPTSSAAR